jgi:hypothetical protein
MLKVLLWRIHLFRSVRAWGGRVAAVFFADLQQIGNIVIRKSRSQEISSRFAGPADMVVGRNTIGFFASSPV